MWSGSDIHRQQRKKGVVVNCLTACISKQVVFREEETGSDLERAMRKKIKWTISRLWSKIMGNNLLKGEPGLRAQSWRECSNYRIQDILLMITKLKCHSSGGWRSSGNWNKFGALLSHVSYGAIKSYRWVRIPYLSLRVMQKIRMGHNKKPPRQYAKKMKHSNFLYFPSHPYTQHLIDIQLY